MNIALMDLDRELDKIISMRETGFPVVSVYMDTRILDKTSWDRSKIFLKNRLDGKTSLFRNDKEKWQSIKEDADRIKYYAENRLEEKTRGLAIFACSHENIFYDYQFETAFENQIIVGEYPHIKPLLEVRHDTQKIIAVMIDSRSARIFDIVRGGIKAEKKIEDYVPSRVKVGGCNQLRFQHHVEDHILRHLKHVITFLRNLVVKEKPAGIIISAQDTLLASFKKELPKDLLHKIIAEENLDIRKDADKVLSRVLEDLKKREDITEKNLIVNIKTKALSSDLGAAGLEETVEALNKKLPFVMAMDKDLKAKGYVCAACGKLFIHEPVACRYCSGVEVKAEEDLLEKILQEAKRQGIKIHLMKKSRELDDIGGIGALLKHK